MSKPVPSVEDLLKLRQLDQKGASVNEYRKELATYYNRKEWRQVNVPPLFVPWLEEEIANKFEGYIKQADEKEPTDDAKFDLLNLNFDERMEYYKKHHILKPAVNWLDDVYFGNHTVYLLEKEQYAFSIGVNYWRSDCPEFLVFMDIPQYGHKASRMLGLLINQLASIVHDDPNTIQAETSLKTIFPRITSDDVKFKLATTEDKNQYLGSAKWFYINFADRMDYKCLKLVLGPKETQELAEHAFESSVVDATYESNENVVHFKHGPVTSLPTVAPPDMGVLRFFTAMQKSLMTVSTDKVVTVKVDTPEALSKAAGYDLETFKNFIKANPEFSAINEQSFEYAMWNNRQDVMKFLIQSGLNLKGDGVNRSLLMNAVQNGFEDAVKILVEHGAPLHDRDEERWTPLSIAALAILHDDMDCANRIIQFLWDSGAREM